ncbi:MAG: hypothetical protein PHX79_06965, partial [Sphaerochaetaceae bacterium]|nr:hypothetical protein [Sphaerochaetaceae bacterium]
MNSKVRAALLFVVLFVIASSSLFAQSVRFGTGNITTQLVDESDNLLPDQNNAGIGTIVKILLDVPATTPLNTAYVDFSQFGGSNHVNMTDINGDMLSWVARYRITPGNLTNFPARATVHGTWASGSAFPESERDIIVTNLDEDPPTLAAGDWDLFYNPSADWLRFSPESTAVAGYSTAPDFVNIRLKLASWGEPGNSHSLQLRFKGEWGEWRNDPPDFTIDHDVNSPELSYDPLTNIITIEWDGKDDTNAFVPEGTYGITLWKISDEAGNAIDFSNYFIIGNEYKPPTYGHSPLLNGTEPQVVLNRMHVVVDNSPLTFVIPLTPQGPFEITKVTKTTNYNNFTVPIAPEVEVWYEGDDPAHVYSFRAQRSFVEDSNDLRLEFGKYWVVLSNGTDKWYRNNAGAWVLYTDFDANTMAHALNFPPNTVQNANLVNFGFDVRDFDFGTYELQVFMQDTAGNIEASPIVTYVYSEDIQTVDIDAIIANPATITSVEITSSHDGGPTGLDAYDLAGNHNFYLDGYLNGNYSDPNNRYYITPDEISIKISVDPGDVFYGVDLNLSAIGLGIVNIPASAFVGGEYTHTITNAQLQAISIVPPNVAGTYSLGQGNNLPVYALTGITHELTGVVTDETVPWPGTETFNLIRPVEPHYPQAGSLAVLNEHFSPGFNSWTYNANTNPATDDEQDFTTFEISVPASTDYDLQWILRVKNPNNAAAEVWTTNGLLPAGTSLPATEINFFGLDNNQVAMISPTGEGQLAVELEVTVANSPFGDSGYQEPGNPITPAVVYVDNVNPSLVAFEDSYDFSQYANARTIVFPTTPVVSHLSNSFEITVKTNETLGTSGWSAVLRDEYGFTIENTDGDAITMNVDAVIEDGTNTYKLLISADNLNQFTEHPNAMVVVRMAWDQAGNPGRPNNPAYPVNHPTIDSDLWWRDSSEFKFPIHILNERPWVSKLEFTHHQSIGSVEYDESGVAANAVQ